MPKKMTTVFFCSECGYESSKWMGQCPACKSWNTFTEENISKQTAKSTAGKRSALTSEVVKLSEVSVREND
ncbi:MAG: DNA repair protein RadA, partial [Lachnospiraceae bacterium]|nr:DNA repair protein RadA [Lachnospiraceae bacterium]